MQKKWFIFSKLLIVFACSFTMAVGFIGLSGNTVSAKSIYDDQALLTDKELVEFMELLPHFRKWALALDIKAQPIVNEMGKADFIYSDEAAQWVVAKNWNPDRFFSVMGRAAAALAIIEEGNDLLTGRPTDMPTVAESELDLVRKHLGTLLKAGSNAPPIK